FRKPDETDEDVRLPEMSNNREAMQATGEKNKPLLSCPFRIAADFYLETVAMWDDWCARRNEVAEEDRGNVLPRSYREVKAAKRAKGGETCAGP
ncbi:hypothetical protein MMC22_011390, partial [Lobaria immixta]|nr:hypothetical protein [Lobaria immixta]